MPFQRAAHPSRSRKARNTLNWRCSVHVDRACPGSDPLVSRVGHRVASLLVAVEGLKPRLFVGLRGPLRRGQHAESGSPRGREAPRRAPAASLMKASDALRSRAPR